MQFTTYNGNVQLRTQIIFREEPLARPRLAENVVCMFDDERPAVQQMRRRGRLPKAVTSLRDVRTRRYLESLPKPQVYALGDKVEVKSQSGWIRGIVVELLDPNPDGTKRFRIMSQSGLFEFSNCLSLFCIAPETKMRPV